MNHRLGTLIDATEEAAESELRRIDCELDLFNERAFKCSDLIKIHEKKYLNEIERENKALDEVLEKYKQPEAQLQRVLSIQEAILEELEQYSGQFKRPEKYFAINLLDGTDEREILNAKARLSTRYLQDTCDVISSKKPPMLDSHFLTELEQLELKLVIKT